MIPELSASKVAGFIGLHKYQSPNEIMYELLMKEKDVKSRIADIEKTHGRRPFNHVLNEVLREQPIQDCIHTGVRTCLTTDNVPSVLEEVEQQAKLILDLRCDSFTPELRNRIAEEVRGKVSKQRGINNETKILDTYEIDRDVKVTERNTKMCRKDFGTFKLVGRIDGYVASENRIVDSKERTRFWNTVPLYDEIQLRCYMALIGATEAELIERFPDGKTRHTKFMNDPVKWASIQTAIERGVNTIVSAAENPIELQRIVFANTVCIKQNGSPPSNTRTVLNL